jgi:hypothetical protein
MPSRLRVPAAWLASGRPETSYHGGCSCLAVALLWSPPNRFSVPSERASPQEYLDAAIISNNCPYTIAGLGTPVRSPTNGRPLIDSREEAALPVVGFPRFEPSPTGTAPSPLVRNTRTWVDPWPWQCSHHGGASHSRSKCPSRCHAAKWEMGDGAGIPCFQSSLAD